MLWLCHVRGRLAEWLLGGRLRSPVAWKRGGVIRLWTHLDAAPVELSPLRARRLGATLIGLAGPEGCDPPAPAPSPRLYDPPSGGAEGGAVLDASIYVGKRVRVWEGEGQSEGVVLEAAGDLRARPELLVALDGWRTGVYAEEDVQVLFA